MILAIVFVVFVVVVGQVVDGADVAVAVVAGDAVDGSSKIPGAIMNV